MVLPQGNDEADRKIVVPSEIKEGPDTNQSPILVEAAAGIEPANFGLALIYFGDTVFDRKNPFYELIALLLHAGCVFPISWCKSQIFLKN